MIHPAQGASVVRLEMENPSTRGRSPLVEEGDGEPGIDKHGYEFQLIDVKYTR